MDWFLDLRAHSHGGPVGTLKITDGHKVFPDATALLADIAGRDVFLMAHGYNVNRPHGTAALSEFKSKLQAGIGTGPVFIGILWPGDCILPIFIDYVWEGSEAEESGQLVGEFVRDRLAAVSGTITFASHSLGARVVLNAVQTLANAANAPRVRNLILFAGAIEDDTLLNEFNAAANQVDRISIVYSLEDHVLALAYPAGNLIGGLIERDDPNLKAALGRLGPTAAWPGKILANPRLPDDWDYGHTDYMSTDPIPGDYPLPVTVPDPSSPPPATGAPLPSTDDWKPCWSAAFAATRWHLP
jgi:hypothetical protein